MPTDSERFNKFIEYGPGCWTWNGSKNNKGYGQFKVDRKMKRAHRVAWTMARAEPLRDGECVLHRCDNPACVRPDHLFLGTIGDNNRDTAAKGRHADMRGSRHPRAKLRDEDIHEIRRRLARGETGREIGARYGVGQAQIYRIKAGVGWAHIAQMFD